MYHQLEQHWTHLPLKKRPIKEIYIYENPFNVYDNNYVNKRRRIASNSSLSSDSSIDIKSIDSGFIDDGIDDIPLDLSITSHFGQIQTIECNECHKDFYNRVRYRAHLRRHASKKSGRYTCHVCQKTFVQRSSLTTHLRIHSGEKPFYCIVCNDSFGDFSTFTKHKRIHSGEKPYSCPVCERSFSQSGNMHRHLKAVHRSNTP